ncbi:MAG: M42 family peptidase, partial [[Clostridium] innocuum]
MDKEFLYDMLRTPSVSGHEIALQKKVIQHMESVADEILTDATGDVISVVNPHADAKVLLCGHIDEIGFLVTRICEDGMLKVTKAGGIHPVLYLGTHVQVVCASQILPGVVVTNSTLENKEQVKADDLFIDLGFDSKAECERYVSIGDPVCAASDVTELAQGKFAGRALDDRIGAFI